MFTLCLTCSSESNQNQCTHSEEQKTLTGTWVIDEVIKAIENGYKIIQIHEIWSYKVQQYNTNLNKTGLIIEMMDSFFKIKQEASGWPKDCGCDQSKQKYVQKFLEQENIQLNAEKICKNSNLSQFAKIILNSFWGKFG